MSGERGISGGAIVLDYSPTISSDGVVFSRLSELGLLQLRDMRRPRVSWRFSEIGMGF